MASNSTRVSANIRNNQSQGRGAKPPVLTGPKVSTTKANGGKGSAIVKGTTGY